MKNTFMEEWRDVIGYEGLYQVSNYGLVKSLYDGRHKKFRELIMTPFMDGWGYLKVDLYKDGERKSQRINRLVAIAFIPIPEELKHLPLERLEADHIDTDRTNNCVWNLRWTDSKGNKRNPLTRQHLSDALKGVPKSEEHRRKIGEALTNGKLSKSVLQLDKDTGEVIRQWLSVSEVQRQLGYSKAHISKCCLGKLNTCGGFKWKYA